LTNLVPYYGETLIEVLELGNKEDRKRLLVEGFYFLIEDIAKFPDQESDLLEVLAEYKKAMAVEGIDP
jgi:hypothetical protein